MNPRNDVAVTHRDKNGTYITVTDAEILQAIAELGKVGVFSEPAGAAAYAGLVKAASNHIVRSEDAILVLNTGSGLKDIRSAMQAVQSAPIIEPNLNAVRKIL